jgi:hypothetical protein
MTFITKKVTAIINSDAVFTSVLDIQGHQHVNIGIQVGSNVSLPAISALSADITLQRHMQDDPADVWRDVQTWSILAASALDGGIEDITLKYEPESVEYRIGCKTGKFYSNAAPSGIATVRLGTS